jgi:hypothetical protein
VKLNLGCWIFYQEGYVNIDRNRAVRADRYEDISTLPSSKRIGRMRFAPDTWLSMWTTSKRASGALVCGVESRRRITITVPDCRGANRIWLERKRSPALKLGPDDGIIAIITGVKAADLGDQEEEAVLHNRVLDESTLRTCMETAGFINVAPVDNHEAMVALFSSTLGWQLALEGVTNQSAPS